MFFDAALEFDPLTNQCDFSLGDDGDLLLDTSSITPVLMSVGLDRRADLDDELPIGRTKFLAPQSFSERRGSPCDALDTNGELAGSKCWLLDRAKETEATLLLYRFWLNQSLEWAKDELNEPAEIDVKWLSNGFLGYRVRVGDAAINIARPVGAAL